MIDSSKEYIICAASWYDDGIEHGEASGANNVTTGYVICGFRHHNIIRLAPENQNFEGGLIHFDCKMYPLQGFMTSWGRFVKRDTAALIAKEVGQVPKDFQGLLFSEDIY